ncbi:MAG: argininosuccinate synthase [Chloroflexi bacterium]|nr:argininosuccinate synthase [Chloroflexota bacterium]
MPMNRVVLAYSGGLDTSVVIHMLTHRYDADVIALTVDLGANENKNDAGMAEIAARARRIGAVDAVVLDTRREFVDDFVWPALQAGAIYEGEYPLATALGRPLIARHLAAVARRFGASAVAHGCTGKGNDQVRFDVTVGTLAPDLRVIAPIREWSLSRESALDYAAEHGIPVTATKRSPYSVDQNLWGRSIEAGILEDPWVEPPADVYQWTVDSSDAPREPRSVEIAFERGVPVALDGERLDGVALIGRLNELAGAHGIGRIDHLENRVVGIKSREIYEAPAATVLHRAHQALEDMTLTRDSARFKARVAIDYADLVYSGLWFSQHREDLAAYVASTQRYVTGEVRLKLSKGNCMVVGRRSAFSLYQHALATYDRGDKFDSKAAEGFISLFGLPQRTQARVQRGVAEPTAEAAR